MPKTIDHQARAARDERVTRYEVYDAVVAQGIGNHNDDLRVTPEHDTPMTYATCDVTIERDDVVFEVRVRFNYWPDEFGPMADWDLEGWTILSQRTQETE